MIGKKSLIALAALFFALCFTVTAAGYNKVADVSVGSFGIHWQPKVGFEKIVLTVSCPDGSVFSKTFSGGGAPYLGLSDNKGNFGDGLYTYELRVSPYTVKKTRKAGDRSLPQKTMLQSGFFTVKGGSIVTTGGGEDGLDPTNDILHYDDVIITGSLCVGFDCANGESFGFDTIILKEHNLRIYFNDTSYTASYPTNNWRITINDSTNGGASYFSVDDVDDGTSIFKIEAGAPSNSLYVEAYGRIGLGTSTPVVELHIKDSDTPTVRLEQDSSGGWTAQTWDVAGNESNFFIRDATNGSKLPFRIQPSTPSSTLCLKSDGKIGIGTWSPAYALELETTGSDAIFAIDRTDGATGKVAAGTNGVQIGSISNDKVHFVVNNGTKVLTVDTDSQVGIGQTAPSYLLHLGGGAYSDGSDWYPSCSRELKENIENLTLEEAIAAVKDLNPVKYNYKKNKEEARVGFIAEDVPELVAINSRKNLSTMDILAVLTRVVKAQQETIEKLNRRLAEVENK